MIIADDSVDPMTAQTADDATAPSNLRDRIIADIYHDELYDLIRTIAQSEHIHTILEIGSSTGQGSTAAFAEGIRENPSQPRLFCIEVVRTLFQELQTRYANHWQIVCYNGSTVTAAEFPSRDAVVEFYTTVESNLRKYPCEQVLDWYDSNLHYVSTSGLPCDTITQIKQDYGIDRFDCVLIDGSEFTGRVELEKVYGATLVLLDDITTFKNYRSHHDLVTDANYVLLTENRNLRNGYSLFQRFDAYLKLRRTNLLAFPNWQQAPDVLYEELQTIMRILQRHDDRAQITLVLAGEAVVSEEVAEIVHMALMELLLADLGDPQPSLEVSLATDLSAAQWQLLLPQITCRLALEADDAAAIAAVGATALPVCPV